jgi:hypothetical protein
MPCKICKENIFMSFYAKIDFSKKCKIMARWKKKMWKWSGAKLGYDKNQGILKVD